MKRDLVKLSAIHASIAHAPLAQSVAYLMSKRPELQQFESVEDLAIALDEVPKLKKSGVAHHFGKVRFHIASEFWRKKVFIGISVIETLLFDCLCDNLVTDPVKEVFRRVKDYGLYQPGFILYPLHSFGILGMGLVTFLSEKRLFFTDPEAGIAVFPQSNADEIVFQTLENGIKALKIRRKLPTDSIEHYLREGPLRWLKNNPVMLVRARTFAGSYYENQFLLLIRLQFALGYIMMLTCFQKPTQDQETARLLSSSRLNNFETLNIKHYIVFQISVQHKSKLEARRIPINVSRAQLAEMSELNVQLDPKQSRYNRKLREGIRRALAAVEEGYVQNSLSNSANTAKARVFRKIFTSLSYFRKSFRRTSAPEDAIVSLAIAFEALLTDAYAPGVTERILRRLKIPLKGVPGCRRMQAAVKELFACRGASVHTGISVIGPDFYICRQAFVHCFLFMATVAKNVPQACNEPIRVILGD